MVSSVESGQITIAADDEYELYLNGRRIGTGGSTDTMDRYDVTPHVKVGRNLVAIKVTNTEGSTAALAVQIEIEERSQGQVVVLSDTEWLTSVRPLPLWYTSIYNDSRWDAAQALGPLGGTPPWDDVEQPTQAERTVTTRPPDESADDEPVDAPPAEPANEQQRFVVEQVLDGDTTGPLIAMTFNEFGHVVASREDGGLLLIHDSDGDHVLDKVRAYNDQVKNCQGLLCLNGEVFACGDGPDGPAVYRLSDEDRNGTLEQIRTLLRFVGKGGEFGAHGITLGADGMLYVVLGNQTQAVDSYSEDSPLRDYYEGDLVRPRYEDPDGHAAGVKAPGGAIVRLDLEGEKLQLVAGGLRNAYDLAVDQEDQLFTQDSDMESDLGAPWYRPNAVYHVIPGAEFGWRSGWAKWPQHFLDRLPATLDTGRGAPAGLTFYNHLAFPDEYRNALFISDWSHGRIHGIRLKRSGSSYSANSELFVDDPALHVTDLAVGPDACLYFCTGGRGTAGGLYRIRWAGKVPAGINDLGEGISAAIRQPQLDAAWSRQKIATIKTEMGEDWDRNVQGVAISTANPWYYRTRALSLMQLFGPPPTTDLLIRLSVAENERVRAKVADLMGLHLNAETRLALISMLEDADPVVRRVACESLVRAGQTAPLERLQPLLKSEDRFEAWAARRVLEQTPPEQWKDKLLASDDHRLVIQGSLALMKSAPSRAHALLVVERLYVLMNDFVTDRDFIDMLRTLQVAILQGQLLPDELPQLRELLSLEFPSGNHLMNRELIRLLTYLKADAIIDRYAGHLQSDSVPEIEKLFLAMHLRFMPSGWNVGHRIAVLELLEAAQENQDRESFGRYLTRISRDFAKTLSIEEVREMLVEGARWPRATMALLYQMPEALDAETREALIRLDQELLPRDDLPSMRLKVGIAAVLARSGDSESLAYLRTLYEQDPERRPAVALGLAQWPSEANWVHLVRSLEVVEGDAAREVLLQLAAVDLAPEQPEHYRRVILHGLKLGEKGAVAANALLEHWTGEEVGTPDDWKSQLAAWQTWYAQLWPDHVPAQPLDVPADAKWTYDRLLHALTGTHAPTGSVPRGAELFDQANCSQCHRFGDRGGDSGPELTLVGNRLMKKQIVRAMLHPSHDVSGAYLPSAARSATERGADEEGGADQNAEPAAGGDAEASKATADDQTIAETASQQVSPMPAGLLDALTLEQIADLFAYLTATPDASLAEAPDDAQLR
jgi:putative heme-binding domain-containing protein